MNLEAMTLEVRPRNPWEAMDLAVRLAVSHWRILFSSWMVCVFPLFLIINIILLNDHPYWAFFLVWFLKPLYDRVPLFILSRVIFSETTSIKDVLNAIPSFFKTGLFSSLTLYRLDPGRAFALPVRQLELLKGKARRQRMDALRRGYNNREIWLFILCAHLETLISWGLIGMLLLMLPLDMAIQSVETLFTDEEPELLSNIVSMLMYFFVMMLVETLYISGGFVLYLNRRIILEGWDIELVFRKLTQRKKAQKVQSIPAVLFCLLFFLFGSSIPQDAQAVSQNASSTYEKILPPVAVPALAPELSKQTIEQVMDEPAFNRFKWVETLEYTGDVDEDEVDIEETRSWLSGMFEGIGKTLAFVFEAGLWLLALVIIFLLVKYWNRLQLGLGSLFRAKEKAVEMPEMLFGLDLREESLPDDVTAQALLLYKQHDYRASLALLYRATLAHLVKNYEFNLPKGATEGDCLAWVKNKLSLSSEAEVNYFIDLTRAWQLTAYAHRIVPDEQMEKLCLEWSVYFQQKQQQENKKEGAHE